MINEPRLNPPLDVPAPSEPPGKPWHEMVSDLLAKAAALGVTNGVELETWMRTAWQAYMDARPGYREYLEEVQLRDQLDELRRAGKIAEA